MKRIFYTLLVSLLTITASAQIATQNAKLLDNVNAGARIGVATPMPNDDIFPANTTVGIFVGKEFTPIFGAEVEGTMWLGSHSFGNSSTRFDGLTHNGVRGLFVGVNGLVNLSNLFGGYHGEPRRFEVSTVLGSGWIHTFVPNMSDKALNGLGVQTGLDLDFNLGNAKAHTINLRPMVKWNVTGGNTMPLTFNKHRAMLSLELGYAYHFKTSNGTHHFMTYDVGAMNARINQLEAELAKKPTVVEKKVEVEKKVVVHDAQGVVIVPFAKNSSTLTDHAKQLLKGVNGSVRIEATASPEGTAEHNQKLSQDRADAVKKFLEANGVKVLSADGCGVTGEDSQRVAIVTVQ